MISLTLSSNEVVVWLVFFPVAEQVQISCACTQYSVNSINVEMG